MYLPTTTHYPAHCHTPPHTATRTAAHPRAHCLTLPHCRTLLHCRTHTTALPHAATRCRTLPHFCMTAAHCGAHCHTLQITLAHTGAHWRPAAQSIQIQIKFTYIHMDSHILCVCHIISFNIYIVIHIWLWGIVFSQLPSTMISLVNHPLGSPSQIHINNSH